MKETDLPQSFSSHLRTPLHRPKLSTVQVNIGKLCNLACRHCHVDSSPRKKRENMVGATFERVVEVLKSSPSVQTLDITGGAPELNPHFRSLVSAGRELNLDVWNRCNLTVLFEQGQETTIDFLASHKVKVIASLPCYSRDNVEKQRGDGVFAHSIKALQLLNKAGYAMAGTGLYLDLIYNPVGPSLPPAQKSLEDDYKSALKDDFGIVFNNLFTITNMPIKRFLADLRKAGEEDKYWQLLRESFNPAAVDGVMCRDLISISWDGSLYDCDFNQALNLPVAGNKKTVWDIDSFDELYPQNITVADHCFGCTAGAGSSCGGALV